MNKPVRLQLSRKKGFDLQAISLAANGLPAVKVDRSTMLGNRWKIGEHSNYLGRRVETSAEAVAVFRALAWPESHHRAWVRENLAGKNLACWCPLTLPDGSPCPCHADVLLEIANAD